MICGRPFIAKWQVPRTCGNCFEQKIYFEKARSCLVYRKDNPVSRLILSFKYGSRFSIGNILGGVLAKYFIEYFGNEFIDIIIPVPLHFFRRFKRGYNQSELLANTLSKHVGLPVFRNTLIRMVRTQPQQGSFSERSRNIKKVFKVIRPKKIIQKNILLIDDVYTTGATVNECAKTLRRNGCKKVFVLTLARADH
ncbi:MAG: hypothetical protein A2161_19410 [Candidatus Schekmanbacteria bacterium RBG_13_48_7]|uniref:Phosphoribosyltransferase domain-containing protein n=1 Tax=Candidatus Schekmanbacteria bacterium RBG_13_48_7 TaxID=1817878 RepID=A0A1F7RWQ5_9BACT|nr:MAG: hypothetical protein A2161_19410 [Candidatus Schekmanbacteria bacterium RBG_13_48_7]